MLLTLWGAFRPRQGRDRIAIPTGRASREARIRHALTVGTHATGLTMFEWGDFVDLFSSTGVVDVGNGRQRALRLVVARKPG